MLTVPSPPPTLQIQTSLSWCHWNRPQASCPRHPWTFLQVVNLTQWTLCLQHNTESRAANKHVSQLYRSGRPTQKRPNKCRFFSWVEGHHTPHLEKECHHLHQPTQNKKHTHILNSWRQTQEDEMQLQSVLVPSSPHQTLKCQFHRQKLKKRAKVPHAQTWFIRWMNSEYWTWSYVQMSSLAWAEEKKK